MLDKVDTQSNVVEVAPAAPLTESTMVAVRYVLTIVGTYLIGSGRVSDATWQQLLAGAMIVIPVVYAVFKAKTRKEALNALVAGATAIFKK